MSKDHLKDKLKQLQLDLEATNKVDAEAKELLRGLDQDINHLLSKESAQANTDELVAQAQTISAKFAAKHPQLEPLLRELIDILGNMGI